MFDHRSWIACLAMVLNLLIAPIRTQIVSSFTSGKSVFRHVTCATENDVEGMATPFEGGFWKCAFTCAHQHAVVMLTGRAHDGTLSCACAKDAGQVTKFTDCTNPEATFSLFWKPCSFSCNGFLELRGVSFCLVSGESMGYVKRDKALTFCEGRGGILPEADSTDDLLKLTSLIPERTNQTTVWMNARRSDNTNQFLWLSGLPVSQDIWGQGQPELNPEEDFAVLYYNDRSRMHDVFRYWTSLVVCMVPCVGG